MEGAVGSDVTTTEDAKADNKLSIVYHPVKNKERECFVIWGMQKINERER